MFSVYVSNTSYIVLQNTLAHIIMAYNKKTLFLDSPFT